MEQRTRRRLLFFKELDTRFDTIGGVHLIVGFQEHPQAFARAHFIIDTGGSLAETKWAVADLLRAAAGLAAGR